MAASCKKQKRIEPFYLTICIYIMSVCCKLKLALALLKCDQMYTDTMKQHLHDLMAVQTISPTFMTQRKEPSPLKNYQDIWSRVKLFCLNPSLAFL